MRRLVPCLWCGSILLAFFAGVSSGPGLTVAALQQPAGGAQAGAAATQPALAGALPPGDYSRMSTFIDQGEPTLFAAEDLRKAHTELQARAAKSGGAISNPRDLMKPVVTRTHSFILLHRPELKTPTATPTAELHEGATDVYVVMAGSGTVTVGGELANRRTVRPGEHVGPIKGGKPFKLKAGDVLDIPPNMAHSTVPDAGGMTYILMKVNVGLYPWSLINGTP